MVSVVFVVVVFVMVSLFMCIVIVAPKRHHNAPAQTRECDDNEYRGDLKYWTHGAAPWMTNESCGFAAWQPEPKARALLSTSRTWRWFSPSRTDESGVTFLRNRSVAEPLRIQTQRLMREIFVPSILKLAISPCWPKMKA